MLDRVRRVLPGVWAGLLLGVAAMAAPTAFAVFDAATAGRYVGHLLTREAYASLALAAALLLLEQRLAARRAASVGSTRFGIELMCVLGALFLTITSEFVLRPMMDAARSGAGAFSFMQLHAISLSCFGIKTLLVLLLAWRAARGAQP